MKESIRALHYGNRENDMDLITQRLKLKDIAPNVIAASKGKLRDKISKTIDAYLKENDDVEFIRKSLVPEDLQFIEGERAVISTISSDRVDRDMEILNPDGVMLENYNGVVLFCHDYQGLPPGKSQWIKQQGNKLIGKTKCAPTPLGHQIYDYLVADFPLSYSVGFIPLAWTDFNDEKSQKANGGARRRYDKWELLEYSFVPVPANPDAVTIMVSKGIITPEKAQEYGVDMTTIKAGDIVSDLNASGVSTAGSGIRIEIDESAVKQDEYECECIECGWTTTTTEHCRDITCDECGGEMRRAERPGTGDGKGTKPGWDETDETIRYRVRDPGDFRDDTMKTVALKEDKPHVNSVMGKLKANDGEDDDPMVVQNLMFPKEDDWTVDEAKKWLSEHEDVVKTYFELLLTKYIATEDGFIMVPADEIPEEKSGRVLSAKNAGLVKECITDMTKATESLTKLLEAAEPQEVEPDKEKEPGPVTSRTVTTDEVTAMKNSMSNRFKSKVDIEEEKRRLKQKMEESRKRGKVLVA